MKIERLELNELDNFINFHSQAYPKHFNYRQRFQFQFLDNPYLLDKKQPFIFIALDKNKKIVGQYGVNPLVYNFGGKEVHCFCGCDLFVYEQYRKYGAGGLLSIKAINSCQPHFSIGISAEARPLLDSLHMEKIGEVHVFLWLKNMFVVSKGLWYLLTKKKIKAPHHEPFLFPADLSWGGYNFSLLSALNDYSPPLGDKDILQFSRSSSFLRWRFFTRPGYYFYKLGSEQSSAYFVVKIINWKNMHLLALIDFNLGGHDLSLFKALINSVKRLAKMTNSDGIITMSSHKFPDQEFKKEFFLRIGAPFEIMANATFPFTTEQIKKRDVAFITMADSDLEFAFWSKDNG